MIACDVSPVCGDVYSKYGSLPVLHYNWILCGIAVKLKCLACKEFESGLKLTVVVLVRPN